MDETELLRQELEHYRQEKERIRRIIGQIGGKRSGPRDTVINVVSKRTMDLEARIGTAAVAGTHSGPGSD